VVCQAYQIIRLLRMLALSCVRRLARRALDRTVAPALIGREHVRWQLSARAGQGQDRLGLGAEAGQFRDVLRRQVLALGLPSHSPVEAGASPVRVTQPVVSQRQDEQVERVELAFA
jgi:hypothetical protein